MDQIIRPAEELFDACREFKLLADAMPQIVWLADASGVTYYYNAKWYEYIGNEDGHDKVAYFYSHVLHRDDSEHARAVWQECVRTKSEFKIQYRFIDKKNNEYRWYLARALPVTDSNGNTTWYGTYTDIDEQKKNEDRLKDALRFRDEFLSIAGHELKTPMTTFRLQVQTGLRSIKAGRAFSTEDYERTLNTCLKQSNRLISLVDGLLDISHIQKGKFQFQFQHSDVSEIIRTVTSEMSHHMESSGSDVHLDLPVKMMMKVDARRIEQVLLNLYVNSAKYAPGARVEVTAVDENQNVRITYKDHGPGIDPGMHARLFERFERGSDKNHISGLGLGLYIVKKIVEGHRGDIRLTSRPGEGAAFEILLPRNENFQ